MGNPTKLLIAVVTTFFATSGVAVRASQDGAVDRPIRDKWALVVGISDFKDKRLSLSYSAKDATDFADYLQKEAGFAPDHVKVIVNKDATQRRILSELGDKWLPRVANPDDLVVLFLSTHGSGAELDVGGQNYLVAYDTDVNDLYTTGIPMQRLAHDIKDRVHCDRVVIFLDACHSGATEAGGSKGLVRTGVDANEFAVGSGQLVIASSKEDQVSWESKKLPNGVFTASLLDALRSNGKTATIDKTFATLKDRVQDTVLRERGILQTPVITQWKGKSILLTAEPIARHPGLEEEPTPVSEPPRPADTDVAVTQKSHPATTVAAMPHASSAQPNLPVSPRSLIVPGLSIGRMRIGMTKGEVLQMLGKPTSSDGNVLTYWSVDRRFFLSIKLEQDTVSQIAFSSPVFKTDSGICLANYSTFASRFKPAVKNQTMAMHLLQQGGLSIITPNIKSAVPVGIVHKGDLTLDSLAWLPHGVAVAHPENIKVVTASGGSVTLPSTNAPVSSTLVVPGISVATVKLGMSQDAFEKLLGKPAETKGDVLIYRTAQGKHFLAIRVQDGEVSDIAFSSPEFATESGINVSNFNNYPDDFPDTKKDSSGTAEIYTIKGGGLSMISPGTSPPIGWLHPVSSKSNSLSWIPSH